MIEKVNVVTRHVLIVPDVEFVMTHRDTAIKARFLALPSRVARLLVGKTDFQEIFALLTEEVTAAMDETPPSAPPPAAPPKRLPPSPPATEPHETVSQSSPSAKA